MLNAAADTAPGIPPPGSDVATLAHDALRRGRLALENGDVAEAIRWLDRAHRLAPEDGTITLALASARLRSDAARAEPLFRLIAQAEDLREAWLGLAASRLIVGDATGAAQALAAALARHAPDATLAAPGGGTFADAVVRAAGADGWCGLTGDGRLLARAAGSNAPDVWLDGALVPAGALPRNWAQARQLAVRLDDRHLLGSPIQIPAIRRVTGFVEAHHGGLRGWAWHPGDPDTDPVLTVCGGGGDRPSLRITATDLQAAVDHAGALARPRGFGIPADAVAALQRPLHVLGSDGRELLGSPLDPGAEQLSVMAATRALAQHLAGSGAPIAPFPPPAIPAEIVGLRPAASNRRPGPIDIVMPVYGKAAIVLACLDSVLATVAPPHRIIVVDDASPEQELAQALDRLAASGRIRLLRRTRNGGFPASANDGVAAAAGHDVVLLNSDTLVPPGWLERLRDACHAAPDIGTATPFSNHASILSYPGAQGSNPVPDLAATRRLDAAARRANGQNVVDIPVGVGFCLYLRRDCIDATGPFRADIFAQGYGEENDFCLRARHLGWRHVAAPGVFVAHLGGASFGPAGRNLQRRNEALLNRLHPGWDALITAFAQADPLAEARRRCDLARWRVGAAGTDGSVILITHDDGGGVEREVQRSAAGHRANGRRPIVLRPELIPGAEPSVVIDGADAGFPNLRYALPGEQPALLRLLRGTSPRLVEVHHTLHHPPAILDLVARLGLPYDVYIHDYPWFCPQVALVGAERRYCGEPAVSGCEACVADAGSVIGETVGVQALRDRSAAFLGTARRVIAPSDDAAARMRNHFPGLRLTVTPQEDDAAIAEPPRPQSRDGRCRVCLLGAVGVHKGFDILLACARDAVQRQLPLEFVLVGHSIDDARLLATGLVFITGPFKPDEAVDLVRAQRASLGLLPSVAPETWSRALTELWLAGLQVAAFDIGAPAERIRRTGRGFVLPFGISARGVNNALVAAAGLSGHAGI